MISMVSGLSELGTSSQERGQASGLGTSWQQAASEMEWLIHYHTGQLNFSHYPSHLPANGI